MARQNKEIKNTSPRFRVLWGGRHSYLTVPNGCQTMPLLAAFEALFWSVEIAEPGLFDTSMEYLSFNLDPIFNIFIKWRWIKMWGTFLRFLPTYCRFWSFYVMIYVMFRIQFSTQVWPIPILGDGSGGHSAGLVGCSVVFGAGFYPAW